MCFKELKYFLYSQMLRHDDFRKNREKTPGIRTLGLNVYKPDYRDFVGTALEEPEQRSFEVPDWKSYVKSQGHLPSCASHMYMTLLEAIHAMKGDLYKGVQFSELFHFWWARQKAYMNTFPNKTGMTLREGAKVLLNIGSTPEKLMPYDLLNYNDMPQDFAQGFADFFKIKGYYPVMTKEDVIAAIPCGIGIKVYADFMFLRPGEKLTTPSGKYYGGHALPILGVSVERKVFKIPGSWGDDWGDEGTCEMPFDYFDKVMFDGMAIEL